LSTYAVSKLAADRLCFVFHYEHNIPVIILRPFNCYGPRETQPYVIPEIVSQLSRGNVVKLGNVNAKRDFTYVEDIAKGAVNVMEAEIPDGEIINLGSNKTYSIKEIAYLVGNLIGYDDIKIEIENLRLRPRDVTLLQCDYSKAKTYINWEPEVDIREGLKRTIEWYIENGKHWTWERLV
jgi:nucleoside-diphosphate-sugar epimerase